MTSVELFDSIKTKLPDADINIIDTVGDQDHYKVSISSSYFNGLSMLQQHRLVYEALGEKLKFLHALSLETFIK
ncbi:BolA family transcriptional regulator [Candidatus Cyrtobacter comes]|uniref:BolA family transcriptional regulator n=1 Tax=Candidatus Cyrtobacter comes TaxID=675776 RepID=A0ABU5L7J9_9RICK|nr:BolA/IbaG family iron-sulfur metabolism protein [Candidatus Cyrtobacter comes]MDZ5762022.1 BolA family transcriptional regulator [Candidatus Cyrtobacter comes]